MNDLHLFIVNPVAGKGKIQKNLPEEISRAAKAAGVEAEIHVTEAPGDGEATVRARGETGRPVRAYACGGDGTLNGVINGAYGLENVSVGVYPCGSGNDFVKMLPHPEKCTDISALISAEARTCDLMEINGRKCCNMTNLGFDAMVVARMMRFKHLPMVTGKMAYGMGVGASLASRMGYGVHAVFDSGEELSGTYTLCAAGNGAVCGGKYRALPKAVLDDGLLDVCMVRQISRVKFVSFIDCYAAGTHTETPELADVVDYRQCTSMTVDTDRTAYLAIDGELLSGTHFEYRVLPGTARIIMP